MFPILASSNITEETLEEIFERKFRFHPSHVQNYTVAGEDEAFVFEASTSDGQGVIIYLSYTEMKQLDKMNEGCKRISGKCDNNIQCYIYTKK